MNFKEFCGNTSLHGWRFVPVTKNPVGRMIWIFITGSAIAVACFFIYTALKDFGSATGTFSKIVEIKYMIHKCSRVTGVSTVNVFLTIFKKFRHM